MAEEKQEKQIGNLGRKAKYLSRGIFDAVVSATLGGVIVLEAFDRFHGATDYIVHGAASAFKKMMPEFVKKKFEIDGDSFDNAAKEIIVNGLQLITGFAVTTMLTLALKSPKVPERAT